MQTLVLTLLLTWFVRTQGPCVQLAEWHPAIGAACTHQPHNHVRRERGRQLMCVDRETDDSRRQKVLYGAHGGWIEGLGLSVCMCDCGWILLYVRLSVGIDGMIAFFQ